MKFNTFEQVPLELTVVALRSAANIHRHGGRRRLPEMIIQARTTKRLRQRTSREMCRIWATIPIIKRIVNDVEIC